MSKSKKPEPIILPVDQAFEHLLNKNWVMQSLDFRTKYKSCRSKYKSGSLNVSSEKKEEMLLECGYVVKSKPTLLTFICPEVE